MLNNQIMKNNLDEIQVLLKARLLESVPTFRGNINN